MIHLRLTALSVALLLLLSLFGCTRETPVVPVTSDGRPTASIRDVTSTETGVSAAVREVYIDVPSVNYWTFNDLHDFLENPERNKQQPFSPDDGEYLVMYDTDGTTVITDWDTRLKDNMVVLQYKADGTVICRFTVHLEKTDLTESTVSPSGDSASVTSRPASQPTESAASSVTESAVSSSISSAGSSLPSSASSEASSSATSGDSSVDPTAKTIITVCGNKNNKALKTAIDAFNKQSKTVEVVLWKNRDADIYTANYLEQALENGNCPDLVLMNRTEMSIAVQRDLLLDLSSLGIDRMEALFHPVSWSNTVLNGRRYGLPVGCVTSCLASNDELLYRFGTRIPKDFTTLISYAQTVTEWSDDTPPIEIITKPSETKGIASQFIMMLWSYGGDFLNEDCSVAAFNSAPGLNVLNTYKQLKAKNLLGENYSTSDFALGNTAYGIVDCTEYSEIFGDKARANFTASPLVMPGSQAAASPLDVYSYCIPATGMAGEPEAAFAFLQFYMATADYSLGECKAQDWIPALTKAMQNEYYQSADWQVFIAALSNAKIYPALSYADTLYDYMAEAVVSVLTGGDPSAALSKAEEKINKRLAR